MAFQDFVVHVLSQQEMGDPVPEDKVWKHSKRYIKWFYNVSHPIMIAPTAFADYIAFVPPYEEVIVEQQRARQPPDPFQIISIIKARVESAMAVLDVFSNPLVLGIMEGIRSKYSVLEEVLIPRRRTRSHSPQELGLIL